MKHVTINTGTNEPLVKRFVCAVQGSKITSPVTFQVTGFKPDAKVAWAALCQFLLSRGKSPQSPHNRVALGCLITSKPLKATYVAKGHYTFDAGLGTTVYDVRILEL